MKRFHIISAILPCLLAFVSADIYDEFLAAEPIFPVIRVSEEPYKDDESKVELATNFTTEFIPTDICSVNKTGLKVGDAGVVTTPYYPRNYPGRTSCEWNLQGVEGTQIEATVFDLFVQPWFFTYFDYVMIAKNGDYKKVDRMAGDMNGKTPFTITSDANKFGIRFVSSSLFNFRGMKMQYVVKSASKENSDIQKENSPFKDECGLSNLINHKLDDNIIGPGKAGKGSFPWMAALLIDGRSFCGGSIISKRHILTAAHCTDGARRITVLVGAENIKNKQDPNRQLFNVSNHEIYQHTNYNPITISHDISILHLSEDIQFNDNVRPICLPNRFFLSENFEGDEVRVSGWGKPRDRAPAISPDLKNTTLSIMTNSKCRRQFRGLVTGNLICTATKWNASPCRGDSGGPLIVKKTLPGSGKEFFMQVGIVSFGGGSCERGIPVGFTRVTAFLDYISEITGKAYF